MLHVQGLGDTLWGPHLQWVISNWWWSDAQFRNPHARILRISNSETDTVQPKVFREFQ